MPEDLDQQDSAAQSSGDSSALQAKIESLIQHNQKLERQLGQAKDKIRALPDGVDVDGLIKFKQEHEQAQLEQQGKYAEARQALEAQFREREAQLQQRLDALEAENRELKLIAPAVAALADTVHDPDEVIRLKLKPEQIERESDGSVVVVDGYQRTPISDWARSSLPQYRLKAPKPQGTGAPVGRSTGVGELPAGSKNPFSREHYNLTEQARIYKTDPDLYARLKAAAAK